MSDRILPELRDRPLSVIRVTRGQAPFMQKNVPEVHAGLGGDGAAVGRGVEAHRVLRAVQRPPDAAVVRQPAGRSSTTPRWRRADRLDHATHLVLDLDPPSADGFAKAVAAAHLVRQALDDVGLAGAVKTSGAKGVHVFVPIDRDVTMEDAAAATRAIARRAELLDPQTATTAFLKADREGKVFVDSTRAGGATVVAAYSPRARPGVPVSFPVAWDDLDDVAPGRLHDPHRRRTAWAIGTRGPRRCPRPSRSRPT